MRGWIWGFVWGLSAVGQEAPAQGTVTEEEFLRAIGEASPAMIALGGELAEAERQRRRAGLVPNPRLEAAREQPSDLPRQDTWLLAWTPPLDGRFGLARRTADLGVVAAREGLALERLRLRHEARRAFGEWAMASERSALVAAHLEVVASLAGAMAARAEKGEESGLAAGRLRLAAAEVRADAATAEGGRIRAEAAVRTWHAGLAAGAQPERPGLMAPSTPAAAASPEINTLTAEAQKAVLEQRLAGRFWGFPELQFGWPAGC
jgi:outer membrane protein TolC